MSPAEQKQHAHELADRLDAGQLDAVVRLLEVITDPVGRSLARIPIEDELISDEETRAVEASKAWLGPQAYSERRGARRIRPHPRRLRAYGPHAIGT